MDLRTGAVLQGSIVAAGHDRRLCKKENIEASRAVTLLGLRLASGSTSIATLLIGGSNEHFNRC